MEVRLRPKDLSTTAEMPGGAWSATKYSAYNNLLVHLEPCLIKQTTHGQSSQWSANIPTNLYSCSCLMLLAVLTEINQPDPSVICEEDVLSLHISVEDSRLVQI